MYIYTSLSASGGGAGNCMTCRELTAGVAVVAGGRGLADGIVGLQTCN